MFDIAFISILSLLAILAFIKGFVASFFSTFNWISAILLSYLISPLILEIFGFESNIFTGLIISIISFFASLIIVSIITSFISKTLITIIPDSIDKSLGFAFGCAKGYVIFSFIFVVITSLYSNDFLDSGSAAEDEDVAEYYSDSEDKSDDVEYRYGPDWLTQAKSYKVLELGSDLLKPIALILIDLLKDNFLNNGSVEKIMQKNLEEKIDNINIKNNFDNIKKIQEIYQNLDDYSEKGYKQNEIEDMNRLIETIE